MRLGWRSGTALALIVAAATACETVGVAGAGSVTMPRQPATPDVLRARASTEEAPAKEAETAAPPEEEGPPRPSRRPIDAKHKVGGGPLLLGASATEVWVILDEGYTVVIDRSTGCATEALPQPPALAVLQKSKDPAVVETEMNKPDVLAAIREVVGLGRHVGALGHRFLLDLVWSPDGRHVFFQRNDLVYRSSDGARSFARVDNHFGSRLAMSADGKHLVYERCPDLHCGSCQRQYGPGCNAGRAYVSLPTSGAGGPRAFTGGQTHLLEMTSTGQAIFTRSEAEICADTFDLAGPRRTSAACVPIPKAATGSWPHKSWQSVSPSGRYGLVMWDEGRPNLVGAIAATDVVALVELGSGRIVKTLLNVRGEVDDDGNIVADVTQEGAGDHTYFYPLTGPRKLLGHHYLLAWHDTTTAILGVHREVSLGARRCDLVKLVKTPR